MSITVPQVAPPAAPDYTSLTFRDIEFLARNSAMAGYFKDINKTGDIETAIAQSLVRIAFGQEIGLTPFRALQDIHMVEGRLTFAAGLQAAMVKRHPKYDYQVQEHDSDHCIIDFLERNEGSGEWTVIGTSSFSIDNAKRAKIYKPGGAWDQWPDEMVFARALTRGIRWHCPDVLGGTVYTPEEAREIEPLPQPVVVEIPASEPEGAIEAVAAAVEETEAMLSPSQRGALVQAGKKHGLDKGQVEQLLNSPLDRIPVRLYEDCKAVIALVPEDWADAEGADDPQPEPDSDGMF